MSAASQKDAVSSGPPRDLLSIEEFNTAVKAHAKKEGIDCVLVLFAMIGGAAVAIAFGDLIRDGFHRVFSDGVAECLQAVLPGIPALVLLFGQSLANERNSRRNPRLHCPHCGKRITGMRSLVVATRNCGHCGRQVVKEPGEVCS